jgi:hypothetical protein
MFQRIGRSTRSGLFLVSTTTIGALVLHLRAAVTNAPSVRLFSLR